MGKKKLERKKELEKASTEQERIQLEEKEFNLKFEKYKILIAARNFHYDNFNKWMTYFYLAIGALFIGYTTVFVSEGNNLDKTFLLNLLCFLGFLCSLFWLLSAKGYYYWNINFISLVNYYEEKILKFPKEERVYFVFANEKTENYPYYPHRGANISTSKVSIFFSFVVSCFWGILLFNSFLEPCSNKVYNFIIFITLSNVLIMICLFIGNQFFKSKINHFHDMKIQQ